MGDDKKLEEMMKKFENTNGSSLKDFKPKEIIIMLNSELKEDIGTLTKKIDKHIEWAEKNDRINRKELTDCRREYTKMIHDHDLIMKDLVDAMPEKGWCGRINAAVFPPAPELPLAYKVNTLWHDRRWIKAIILLLIGTGITSAVNLALYLMGVR